MPVIAEGGSLAGFVQGGFVLTLHDAQSQSLVSVIVVVALLGLLGAAVVTLLVTGRALVPIRQSFDAQRRFVADASHELRTPTALIRANAEVLAREGLVSDDGRLLVGDIVAESDRLTHLIGDLLQLAASDASGLVLDRRPLDLAALAADTVRQSAALAAKHGVSVRMAPSPVDGSTLVSGDPDRLIELLLILLENAFDHSPPDGIITVEAFAEGRMVVMTVADQGPGIPVADRDKVFQPFTRLPGVARDRSGARDSGWRSPAGSSWRTMRRSPSTMRRAAVRGSWCPSPPPARSPAEAVGRMGGLTSGAHRPGAPITARVIAEPWVGSPGSTPPVVGTLSIRADIAQW